MLRERVYPRQKSYYLYGQNFIRKRVNVFYNNLSYIYSWLEGSAISHAKYALWSYQSCILNYLPTSNPQQLFTQVTIGFYSLEATHPIMSFAIVGASDGSGV